MPFALVFPGQGSQRPGMGREFHDYSSAAREVFARASEALGWDVAEACFSAEPQVFGSTAVTQPALFTAEAAALAALREASDQEPVCAAGHSLGEYTALHAAGALSLEDGVRLVAARGAIMEKAAAARAGGMAAVIGASADDAAGAVSRAGLDGTLWVANLNAPDQVVISGEAAALSRLIDAARDLGLKKVVRLDVAGAFHTPLMDEAAAEFARVLDGVTIEEPQFPVVTNAGAVHATTAAEIECDLRRHMNRPVRWTDSVAAMAGAGVTAFVEVGPGNVLARLIRRTAPAAAAVSVERPDNIPTALQRM